MLNSGLSRVHTSIWKFELLGRALGATFTFGVMLSNPSTRRRGFFVHHGLLNGAISSTYCAKQLRIVGSWQKASRLARTSGRSTSVLSGRLRTGPSKKPRKQSPRSLQSTTGTITMAKWTCFICGHKTLDSRCDWDICPVCFWEDDTYVHENKDESSPANGGLRVSEAQANYVVFGCCSRDCLPHVRSPSLDETLDPEWHPLPSAVFLAHQMRATPDTESESS